METKNVKSKILMAILVFSFVLFQNIGVYAAENVINIPLIVRHEFNIYNKNSKEIDMSGKYELKAISENSPMPKESKNGSFVFNIDGNDKQFTIPLSYTHGGMYTYEIKQITQSKDNYIYDKNKYKIAVYIKNTENSTLTSQIIVENEKNEKCKEISFYNSYEQKNEINDIIKKPNVQNKIDDTSKINVPKTGDSTNIGFYILILAISFILLIGIQFREYKNRKNNI